MSVLVDTLWVEIISAAVFLILIGSILFFNLSLVFLVKKNHKGAPSFCGNRCMKWWYMVELRGAIVRYIHTTVMEWWV